MRRYCYDDDGGGGGEDGGSGACGEHRRQMVMRKLFKFKVSISLRNQLCSTDSILYLILYLM